MEDEGLDRVEPVGHQRGDMPVTPELSEQGLGVPEDEVGGLWPGQRRVAGEERATGRPAGGDLGCRASQFGGTGHLAGVHGLTQHAPEGLVGRPRARRGHLLRGGRRPGAIHAPTHEARLEVEEGGDDNSRVDRPHRRRPAHEVAGLGAQAEGRVRGRRLGREVHHGVDRLDRAPRLAGDRVGGRRFVGGGHVPR